MDMPETIASIVRALSLKIILIIMGLERLNLTIWKI